MDITGTPCIICNEWHKGSTLEYKGHAHQDAEGCGNVRLLVVGAGKVEHCWRCGCQKSGWVNVKNEISSACSDNLCVCHTAEEAA